MIFSKSLERRTSRLVGDLSKIQVIVGDESHVYHYEAGGMSVLGGVAFNVQPNMPNGEIPLERLEKAVRCILEVTNGNANIVRLQANCQHLRIYSNGKS